MGCKLTAQASTDDQAAESTVFKYLGIFFWGLVFALPQFFIVLGAAVMFSFLTNMIYSDGRGESTAWCRESLRESINLALFIKDVETGELNPDLTTVDYPNFSETTSAIVVFTSANLLSN